MNASHTPRGREGAKPPLNGTKTHPLTEHGFSALKQLRSGPLPAQSFNPGVIDRLLRESLIELKDGPSPYRTKPGVRSYAHITEAALAALSKARGEK